MHTFLLTENALKRFIMRIMKLQLALISAKQFIFGNIYNWNKIMLIISIKLKFLKILAINLYICCCSSMVKSALGPENQLHFFALLSLSAALFFCAHLYVNSRLTWPGMQVVCARGNE